MINFHVIELLFLTPYYTSTIIPWLSLCNQYFIAIQASNMNCMTKKLPHLAVKIAKMNITTDVARNSKTHGEYISLT